MSKKNIIISKKKHIDVIKINKENSYNEKKNNIIYNIKDLNDKKNIFSDKEFGILNDNIDEKTSQNNQIIKNTKLVKNIKNNTKLIKKDDITINNYINSDEKTNEKTDEKLEKIPDEKLEKIPDDNNFLLMELLKRQNKNISSDKKLKYNDIKRISKFLSSSIFSEDKCSIWTGYITNEKNQSKGTYVNFYFNKKKIALHRLLYINYIGDVSNNEYIKFSCKNKGKCCNINHMEKYFYCKNINYKDGDNNSLNEKEKVLNNNEIHINLEKNKLIVEL